MNNPLQTEQDSTGPALTWQLVHAVPGPWCTRHRRRSCRTVHCCDTARVTPWSGCPAANPKVSAKRDTTASTIRSCTMRATSAGWACWRRPWAPGRPSPPDPASPPLTRTPPARLRRPGLQDGGSAHGVRLRTGPAATVFTRPERRATRRPGGQANSTPRADTRDAAGSGPSSSPSRNTSDKPADSPSRAARTAHKPAAHANSTDAPTGAPSSSTGRSTVDKPAAASTPTRSTPDTPAPARSTQDTPAATSAPTSRVPAARAAAPESAVTNATTSRPDAVTYDVSGGPSDGTVTLSPQTGAFDYTPRHAPGPLAGDAGALRDSFSVTINDGQGDKATLPVAVFAGEKPPNRRLSWWFPAPPRAVTCMCRSVAAR